VEGMAEERRLFYVGITRAEQRLYLTLAHNRMTFGISEPSQPSRFLEDIPEEVIIENSMRPKDHSQRSFSGAYEWEKEEEVEKPSYVPTHHVGQRIKHSMFGEGIVLGVEIDGRDEIVNIFFDNGANKKLLASLAKLEIL
jgi:DNA helicase-2/ATP-dependent DNA helicase PcrA